MDLFEEIVRMRRAGQRGALATIIHTNGCIPSYESSRMLVREDGSTLGTVGGGCVEAEMARRARAAIENGRPVLTTYDLTPEQAGEEGLVCGGRMEVFIEPLEATPGVAILGAGHVARPLCDLAAASGFRVSVLDDREKFANAVNFRGFPHIPGNDLIMRVSKRGDRMDGGALFQ